MTARNPGFGVHVYVYGMWDRGIDARGLWMGRDPESPGCELIRVTTIGRLRSDGSYYWKLFSHPEAEFSVPTMKVQILHGDTQLGHSLGTPFGDEVTALLDSLGLKVGHRPRREPGKTGGRLNDPGKLDS